MKTVMERNKNFLMKLVCLLQCNLVIVSISIVIATFLQNDLCLIHLLRSTSSLAVNKDISL